MTEMIKNDAPSPFAIHGPPGGSPKVRRFDASDLFGDLSEIEIAFKTQIYRLRITRQDKLILTK